MSPRTTPPVEEVADRIQGAVIEYVEQLPDGSIALIFGHRGTDDDSGYLVVAEDAIHFGSEPS